LPLWASAALPAAVLASTLGPAIVLAVSLGGSALAVLLLPLVASAGSGTALTRLLGCSSLLQGSMFPCIVALQACWIPRGGLDDIWASRTLGVGAVVAELCANAAPVAWSPAFGASPRSWCGTTVAVGALSGLLAGCALLVALVAPQASTSRRSSRIVGTAEPPRQQLLPISTILSARPIRATLMSAFAAGSALGAAEMFLPAAAVQQGMALVRFGDIAFGWLEKRLRSGAHPMRLRRVRQLASTLAPLSAAVGLLCLVPSPGGLLRKAWPGLAAFCLFIHSPLGFGAGFGCSYREVGGERHAGVVGAFGSIVSTTGAALGPQAVMWLRSKGASWEAAFGLLIVQQFLAALGWWRYCEVDLLTHAL
jgi:hypothetical protein